MKVQVKDKQGREVNPYYLFEDTEDQNLHEAVSNLRFNKFEQSVKTYPAPGIDDGTHECELKWQYQVTLGIRSGEWNNFLESGDPALFNKSNAPTRQIWVLAEQDKEQRELPDIDWDAIGSPLDVDPSLLEQQEEEVKTAEEVFNDYINIRTVGNDVAQIIIDAMVTYAAQFRDTNKSTRIAELEARVAELEGVLNTKQEARFTELVNYEINWAKSEISNLPKVNDGTQKAFFDGFILGCAKIKQRALKELATNAIKNQQ